MPNVVLEALASGLPVVATDVGQVSEMLKDCEWCRVVSRGDALVARLADAVSEVAIMQADRGPLAKAKCVRSWCDMAKDVVELLSGEADAGKR
jgi:glycosyltransferase involved in cell wall biosynthesis